MKRIVQPVVQSVQFAEFMLAEPPSAGNQKRAMAGIQRQLAAKLRISSIAESQTKWTIRGRGRRAHVAPKVFASCDDMLRQIAAPDSSNLRCVHADARKPNALERLTTIILLTRLDVIKRRSFNMLDGSHH
jgi:hypothetical protein